MNDDEESEDEPDSPDIKVDKLKGDDENQSQKTDKVDGQIGSQKNSSKANSTKELKLISDDSKGGLDLHKLNQESPENKILSDTMS